MDFLLRGVRRRCGVGLRPWLGLWKLFVVYVLRTQIVWFKYWKLFRRHWNGGWPDRWSGPSFTHVTVDTTTTLVAFMIQERKKKVTWRTARTRPFKIHIRGAHRTRFFFYTAVCIYFVYIFRNGQIQPETILHQSFQFYSAEKWN